jgi:hypothetical protein
MKKNWEYFTHSTNVNFLDILNSGYLLPSTNLKEYDDNIPEPYVYNYLIFSGLPQDRNLYWNFYNNKSPFIFVIDTSITKDMPFYLCSGVYYGRCVKNKDALIMKSDGNLKKKVSLTRVKNYIKNNTLHRYYELKKKSYVYSHEVLFPTVPIEYIKAILINQSISKKYSKEIKIAVDKYPTIKFSLFDDHEPHFDIYFENI